MSGDAGDVDPRDVDLLAELDGCCPAWDHPVWADGRQDHFRCELPAGHTGYHQSDDGWWDW